MVRWKCAITATCSALILAVLASAAWADGLTVVTENMGQSNHIDQDGELTGFNVEVVREILRRLELPGNITVLPWSRGVNMALEGPGVVLFSTARTPGRESLFKWVGPLHQVRNVLYGRKESSLTISSLDAARHVKLIGCIAADVREELMRNLGFENLFPVHGTDANSNLLRMLVAGRVDVILSSAGELHIASEQTGISMDSVRELLVVQRFYTYLAFSTDVEDAEIERWQVALDSMKSDGTYERIMSSYPVGKVSMALVDPTPR